MHRALGTWLRDHGVISDDLARAALDLPILATRQALYRALTNDGTAPASTFETYIADIYRRGIPATEPDGPRQTSWSLLWCAGPLLAERRIYQALKDQPTPGAAMPAGIVAVWPTSPTPPAGRTASLAVASA